MKNLILAGGSGTRLWPLSRKLMPKQFLKLFDGQSLFQKTLLRNHPLVDEFIIVTNEEHYFIAKDQIEELNIKNYRFILEPFGKNTAPAIAFGAFEVDDLLFVTPADHFVEGEGYRESFQKAAKLAQDGYMVTFGITPTSPHTGYGYIEAEGDTVKTFHEKPDAIKAKEYLEKGFLWNSGMFLFNASTYLQELQTHAPDIFESAKEAYEHRKTYEETARILPEYMEKVVADSIDYAVMEKSDKIKVVKASFNWDDIGSFDSLAKHLPSKEAMEIESQNNFYHSDNPKKVIATIGLEDFIVIDTRDALLIAHKNETQKVKEVVAKIQGEVLESHTLAHRPWGTYETLIDENGYKIKRIVVKPGKRLSLQKHFHRNEHWIVVSGTATVTVGNKTYLVRPNESTYIKMGEIHRLANEGKIPVILIEAQVGEYTKEDDIVRIEDDYQNFLKVESE